MEELDPQLIAGRSIRGVFAFISRSFVIQVISFARDVLLTILLSPAIFGVFYIVESIMAMLAYFSDIGLAGALIQKKEEVTGEDLATTFTIQQIIVLTLVGIVLVFLPQISMLFHLEKEGVFLLQAFIAAFFLSSLKTIPSVILERRLEFGKFVIPQVVETLFYSVVVVVLALKGFGINSFSYAVLARGLSGLIAMYIICPWRIHVGFSKESASKLLHFGIPLQVNSILALIKDNLLILFLGTVLSKDQVGYIGFAQKWAFTPLRLMMDNVIRVTFSSFSRLQHEKVLLGKAFEKSLFVSALVVYPSLVGLSILAPYLVDIIPKYQKWDPALLSLTFFCINAAFAVVLVPLTNVLNAIGKIKITLYLMIFSTIAIWVLTPISLPLFGFNAVAAVSAIVNLSVIGVWYVSRKYIQFSLVNAIRLPVLGSLVMGLVLFFLSPIFISNFITFLLVGGVGGCAYLLIIYVFGKAQLQQDLALIKRLIIK